ncbi:MAG: hypothetical protein PVJ76_21490, partial [Gemmatimonadota bacterium]
MGSPLEHRHVLGLDVGAVSVSAAEIDLHGTIVQAFYELHHGEVEECLRRVLKSVDLRGVGGIAATTSTPAFLRSDRRYNNQICLIASARRVHPVARSILVVGAERFGLVRFDPDGTYLSYKANSLCAAGTG